MIRSLNITFKDTASPSVPDGYPAEAIFGGMVGEAHIDHGSNLESGWGRSVAVVVIGDGIHHLPDSIRVRFFSYIDNKFYQKESYPLPQYRIKELLEKSYKDKGREYKYTTFEVSLAPGGWVTVWLSGGLGQIEFLSFQADEADWDYKRVFPNRNASREEMRQLYMEDM